MINFEKRWEAKHPLYRLEAVLRSSIDYQDVIANEQTNILISVKNSTASTYYEKIKLKEAADIGYQFIVNRKNVKSFITEAEVISKKLISLSKGINDSRKERTNQALHAIYQEYHYLFSGLLSYYNLSRPDYLIKVDKVIKKRIWEIEKRPDKQEEIFVRLTTPPANSKLNLQDIEQLKLALLVIQNVTYNSQQGLNSLIENNQAFKNELEKLVREFAWITTQEGNAALSEDDYIKKIKELSDLGQDKLEQKINKIESRPRNIKNKKIEFINKYAFDDLLVQLTDSVADLSELRLKVRLWWTEAVYYSLPLFEELNIKAGFNQNKINGFYYSEYLLKDEVADLLQKNKIISKKEIEKRAQRSLLLMKDKQIKLFVGLEAEKIEADYIKTIDHSTIKEIKGHVANTGKAKGNAWVISPSVSHQLEKARQMKPGDILVAAMTRPQFIEAISKSAAIVTDEGGVTCHAAIVSRELNKPCIIGTHIATKVIKDGDEIEVDTNTGVVKIIKQK